MKASIIQNTQHSIVLPQQRRPSDILEESYVTQNVNNSRRSSTMDSFSQLNSSNATPLDVETLVNSAIWSTAEQAPSSASVSTINTNTSHINSSHPSPQEHSHNSIIHPLDSSLILNNWNNSDLPPQLKNEEWNLPMQTQATATRQSAPEHCFSHNNSNSNFAMGMMPQTPPVNNTATYSQMLPMNSFPYTGNFTDMTNGINSAPPSMTNTPMWTPNSGLVTPPMSSYFQARGSLPINKSANFVSEPSRRNSSDTHHPPRTHGRRSSSHPSVASVVSLTAHEPVSKIIDGIEYITFLYSHDRLVKEYTVRTDVDNVNIDDISMDFRIQNAIYPRANVEKSEYDGNRWGYETTCNQLGWKLCWLNKEQLFGRRGLIQRAVDSYRNRHAEMRSRRVTRQEKVANGTLRKRRSKKSLSHNTL